MSKKQDLYDVLEAYLDCVVYVNEGELKIGKFISQDELGGLIGYLEELLELRNIEDGILMNGYSLLKTNKHVEATLGLNLSENMYINKYDDEYDCYQYVYEKTEDEQDYVFDHYNVCGQQDEDSDPICFFLTKRFIDRPVQETHREAYYFMVAKGKNVKEVVIKNSEY